MQKRVSAGKSKGWRKDWYVRSEWIERVTVINTWDLCLMNQAQMEQNIIRKWQMGGTFLVRSSRMLTQRINDLNVHGCYMKACLWMFKYGCETLIWREKERSGVRDVQMNNIRSILGR